MALQIPELEGGDFIRVKQYEPDEWPEPPRGLTFKVSVARRAKFLFWEFTEDYMSSEYPVFRVDYWREGQGEAGLQAAIDSVAANYFARRKGRAEVSQAGFV
jgi:hypothetical protein